LSFQFFLHLPALNHPLPPKIAADVSLLPLYDCRSHPFPSLTRKDSLQHTPGGRLDVCLIDPPPPQFGVPSLRVKYQKRQDPVLFLLTNEPRICTRSVVEMDPGPPRPARVFTSPPHNHCSLVEALFLSYSEWTPLQGKTHTWLLGFQRPPLTWMLGALLPNRPASLWALSCPFMSPWRWRYKSRSGPPPPHSPPPSSPFLTISSSLLLGRLFLPAAFHPTFTASHRPAVFALLILFFEVGSLATKVHAFMSILAGLPGCAHCLPFPGTVDNLIWSRGVLSLLLPAGRACVTSILLLAPFAFVLKVSHKRFLIDNTREGPLAVNEAHSRLLERLAMSQQVTLSHFWH